MRKSSGTYCLFSLYDHSQAMNDSSRYPDCHRPSQSLKISDLDLFFIAAKLSFAICLNTFEFTPYRATSSLKNLIPDSLIFSSDASISSCRTFLRILSIVICVYDLCQQFVEIV